MDDMTSYREIFAEEAIECLDLADEGVRALILDSHDTEALACLIRGAHNLRGMCAAMGFDAPAILAERIEILGHKANSRTIEVNARTFRSVAEEMATLRGFIEREIETGLSVASPASGSASGLVLTPLQRDALGEVGNIGTGHAASALSGMLGLRFSVSPPSFLLVRVDEIVSVLTAGPAHGVVTTGFTGEIGGRILVVAEHDVLHELSGVVRGVPVGASASFDLETQEVVRTAGSVLAAAYIQAIAQLTGLTVQLGRTDFELEADGALQRAVFSAGSKDAWTALVRTSLFVEGRSFDVVIAFVPDRETLSVMFTRLGIA